jgi:hypothetical protein
VGQGRLRLDVEQLSHHHEVLSDAFRVLLGQRAQLVLDAAIDLVAGDALADRRFRLARRLGRQARTTASVVVLRAACAAAGPVVESSGTAVIAAATRATVVRAIAAAVIAAPTGATVVGAVATAVITARTGRTVAAAVIAAPTGASVVGAVTAAVVTAPTGEKDE